MFMAIILKVSFLFKPIVVKDKNIYQMLIYG